jgi:hypothetical protein
VAVAREAVGPAVLGGALERLHPWALSGATRTGMNKRRGLLDDLCGQVTAAAGAAGAGRPGEAPTAEQRSDAPIA